MKTDIFQLWWSAQMVASEQQQDPLSIKPTPRSAEPLNTRFVTDTPLQILT